MKNKLTSLKFWKQCTRIQIKASIFSRRSGIEGAFMQE